MNLYILTDILFAIKEPIDNEVGFNYAFKKVCKVQYKGLLSYIRYLNKRKSFLSVWKLLEPEQQLKWAEFQEHEDRMIIERKRQKEDYDAAMKKWHQCVTNLSNSH